MIKKLNIILCALILIPTITYAKLNKMDFISETSIQGKRMYPKRLGIYIQEDKLLFTDYAGNTIKEEPYNKDYNLKYNYKNNNLFLYNPLTGHIMIKGINYNTIASNTIPKGLKNPCYYKEGYIVMEEESNGIKSQYIYDSNLKLITKINNNSGYLNIYEDRIINVIANTTVRNGTEEQKLEIKVYDRKGKIIQNKIISVTGEGKLTGNLLSNGNIIAFNSIDKTATLYDTLTFKQLKVINNIEEVYTGKNGKNYLVTFGSKKKYDEASTKEDKAKVKVQEYNNSLEPIGDVTYNDYLYICERVVSFPEKPLDKVKDEMIDILINEEGSYYEIYDIVEYRNEYYVLMEKGFEDFYLYHFSKDLKEHESINLALRALPTDFSMDPQYIAIDNNDIVLVNKLHIKEYVKSPNPNDKNITNPKLQIAYPDSYLNTYIYQRYKIIGEPYNITTNIKGKGTIEVPASSQPNEIINVNVKPEKGYTTANIYVVDDNGKRINLTNNNFKMPEGNITLEVEFTVLNPETSTKSPYILITFVLLITILILLINKKVIK